MKDYTIKIKGKKDFIEKFKVTEDGYIKISYSRSKSKKVSKDKKDMLLIKMEKQIPDSGKEIANVISSNKDILNKRIINVFIMFLIGFIPILIIMPSAALKYIILSLLSTTIYYKVGTIINSNKLFDILNDLYFKTFINEVNDYIHNDYKNINEEDYSKKLDNKINKILTSDGNFNVNNMSILSSDEKSYLVSLASDKRTYITDINDYIEDKLDDVDKAFEDNKYSYKFDDDDKSNTSSDNKNENHINKKIRKK